MLVVDGMRTMKGPFSLQQIGKVAPPSTPTLLTSKDLFSPLALSIQRLSPLKTCILWLDLAIIIFGGSAAKHLARPISTANHAELSSESVRLHTLLHRYRRW